MTSVVDKKNGKKWEIYEHDGTPFGEKIYSINYYEYYKSIGWKKIEGIARNNEYFSKQFVEESFGIKL